MKLCQNHEGIIEKNGFNKKKKRLTTLKYHNTPTRGGKIKNADSTRGWWGCGATETLVCSWWWCTVVQPLWRFLTKLNLLSQWDPITIFFGIYSKGLKTYVFSKSLETATYCMVPTIGHPVKGKTMQIAKGSVVARSWEEEERRKGGSRTQIFRAMNILCLIL